MIDECLDEEREFGIVWMSDDGLKEVGCSARITRVLERFDDGRMNILVRGRRAVPAAAPDRGPALPRGRRRAARATRTRATTPPPTGRASATPTWSSEVTDSRPESDDLPDSTPTAWRPRSTSSWRPSRQLLELRSESGRLERLDALFDEALERIDLAETAAERARRNGSLRGAG